MNVFVNGSFVCHLDNRRWTEENGRVPWEDIGREHVTHYEEVRAAKEYLYGKTEVPSRNRR